MRKKRFFLSTMFCTFFLNFTKLFSNFQTYPLLLPRNTSHLTQNYIRSSKHIVCFKQNLKLAKSVILSDNSVSPNFQTSPPSLYLVTHLTGWVVCITGKDNVGGDDVFPPQIIEKNIFLILEHFSLVIV